MHLGPILHTPQVADPKMPFEKWWKKKIGLNADDKNKEEERLLSMSIVTGDGRVCHMVLSANIDGNTIVNGFQAGTDASIVIHRMIAECWSSMNSSQQIVGAHRDIALLRS